MVPTSRNIVPSHHKNMKSNNNIVPSPIQAINWSGPGGIKQILSQVFLMNITKFDESKSKDILGLQHALLALQNNYN